MELERYINALQPCCNTGWRTSTLDLFIYFFHPHLYVLDFVAPCLVIVVTQIRGHIAGSSLPTLALLWREIFIAYLPRRLASNVLTHAIIRALRSWCLARNKNSMRRIEPWT